MQTADLQKRNRVARRRLWRASLEDAHRFKAMVEHAHALISFLGHDGTILYGSPSKERILGYGTEELVGTSLFALVHADDLHDVQARFADLLERSGDAITIELRLRHKDGSWRWMEAVATNLLHIESLRAITVGYRDITGRKRRELGQRLVVEAGSQLDGTLGYERILDRLARLLVPKIAGKCSIYTVERHGRITRRVPTDSDPPTELQRTHPARRVIETGEPRLVWDSLIVPLVVHGRVIGALGVAAGGALATTPPTLRRWRKSVGDALRQSTPAGFSSPSDGRGRWREQHTGAPSSVCERLGSPPNCRLRC